MTFKDLLIKPELIDALQVQNITQPTQIQCKVAKPVFDGRDVIACSSTGSGKTLAYLLPVLSSVDLSENTLQALVLVPTRNWHHRLISRFSSCLIICIQMHIHLC